MREYSKEESVEIINRINKMQRIVFKYRKENGREPTDEEIASLLNESIERISELKAILKELEEQDKAFELEYKTTSHNKEDIEKAKWYMNKFKMLINLNADKILKDMPSHQ